MDKARLVNFGWLQADQRMPLPRADELHSGRRPIGKPAPNPNLTPTLTLPLTTGPTQARSMSGRCT